MKKKIYAALAFALYATTFHAQQIYELSAPAKEKTIYTGHLKMGGSNPSGGNISVNSYYMSIDGKPVIPVMGEFHFYPLSPCTVGTGDCKDESRWGECIANLYFLGIT